MKDFNVLRSWFPRRKMEEVTRPVYKSDFNWTNYASRAQLRCVLGLWVIRESEQHPYRTRNWVNRWGNIL